MRRSTGRTIACWRWPGTSRRERAIELVKKYFGGIKPGPPLARVDQFVPRLDTNLREHMQDRVPQTRIYRVYHAPAWRDPVLQRPRSVRQRPQRVPQRPPRSRPGVRRRARHRSHCRCLSVGTGEHGGDYRDGEGRHRSGPGRRAARSRDRSTDRHRSRPRPNWRGPAAASCRRSRAVPSGSVASGGRSDILAQSMTLDGRPDGYLDRLERTARGDHRRGARDQPSVIGSPHYTLVVNPYPPLQPGQTAVDRTVLPPLGSAPEVRVPKGFSGRPWPMASASC